MADNTHPNDNPNVLTDEITSRNGAATSQDTNGHLPQAQVFKLARGGDGIADDLKPDGARLPVDDAAEGSWDYRGGPPLPVDPSGASVTETVTGRVLAIDCLAGDEGGTLRINTGAVIPIPADVSKSWVIRGRLLSPTVALTGVVHYTIEVVA